MAAKKAEKALPTFKDLKSAIKAFEAGKLPKKTQFTSDGMALYLEVEQKPVKNEAGEKVDQDPHVFVETSYEDLTALLLKRAGLKIKIVEM
jgi:hypothetical protein